jgi:hexosaminidase
MKYKILSIFALSFIWLSGFAQQENASINIIPAPVKLVKHQGSLSIKNIQVNVKGFNKPPTQLLTFAEGIVNSKPNKANSPAKANQKLTLDLDKKIKLSEEGYQLSINNSGIAIKANTERGLFYGLQTLSQIVNLGTTKEVPYLEIEDYPRYAYRGALLDVGRYMFPVAFIKNYIDLLAKYKLNTFHWHLTEDQGWRIEIKKYPKLTTVGSYRDQTLIGHLRKAPLLFDETRYGGFYTQEEVKDVVAYATAKYVTVIPEIEMPGHSLGALTAYPELGCGHNPGPYKVAQKWGVFEDIYCAGKDNTFNFIQDVLDEVMTLFPSKYIHIGGDESPKAKWKTCEFCQKRIKDEKLKDEHELQSYFIQRIEKYLNKKGRQIIGWDEILEGGLAPNATVMSWRGTKGGIAAAQQNHKVIMSPYSHLYLDYTPSKSKEEPITIGGYHPIEKIYAYDPTPKELDASQHKYIWGVQGNVWTEYMSTPEKVLYMTLPKLFALSEIAWTPLANKNWKDFSEHRLPNHLGDLDRKGTIYRVPEPIGAKDTTIVSSQYTLNYKSPVKGAKIYYTINGYIPYEMDYLYSKPLTINIPAGEERVVKSVVITPAGRRSVVVTTLLKNK